MSSPVLHPLSRACALRLAAILVLPAGTSARPPTNAPAFALPVPAVAEIEADLPRQAAATSAHATWRDREGGAEFQPTLTFLRGTPVLMLVTATREPAARALLRKRAIVQACGFLLDEAAFANAVICVVESDHARPGAPSVRNHAVSRSDFVHNLRKETGATDIARALGAARADDALTLRLCGALKIE